MRRSVQTASGTRLRRGIFDYDEGRNAWICHDAGASWETASQVKERLCLNAVGVATRVAVRRGFGKPIGGARLFDQTHSVLWFKLFKNLIERLFLCFRPFHALHFPLAIINGGGRRKAETSFRKNYSFSESLVFGFRAGEEVRTTRALMVGYFRRKLPNEDAANGVIVVFEASVDSALAQVKVNDFVG